MSAVVALAGALLVVVAGGVAAWLACRGIDALRDRAIAVIDRWLAG